MANIRVKVAGADVYFLDVPEQTVSHNILRTVNLEPRKDILIQRLKVHDYNKKCKCFACNLSGVDRTIVWLHPYVRFDIGFKNVRLQVEDGDRFIAVKQGDIERWSQVFRNLGFPVGKQDLFRFAAVQSLPSKRGIYLFDEDHEFFNLGEFLGSI